MVKPVKIGAESVYDVGSLVLTLDISSATLARARRKGRLRYTRQGRRVLYTVGLQLKHLYPTKRAVFIVRESGRRKVHSPSDPSSPRILRDEQTSQISECLAEHFAMYHKSARVGAIFILPCLSRLLNLPMAAPDIIGVGHRCPPGIWTFPEFDGSGQICGIILRDQKGAKQALPGSIRGLTIPIGLLQADAQFPGGPLYLAEGATDTAALLRIAETITSVPTSHDFSCRPGNIW